jgi:hypothetical protein
MFSVLTLNYAASTSSAPNTVFVEGDQGVLDQRWLSNFVLMRPTDLRDRNNARVYEDDILEITLPRKRVTLATGYRIRAIVRWHECGFWFSGEGFCDCNWHFYNDSDRVILGNAHANPDLLELIKRKDLG